ncbi:glutathione S-transferase family protein [Aquabacter spiritensis]|uniref:Glutathione S-transferase n=1 Tax=Aquabacter spiritensis TaxID=933073 RepID=A0A4R3LS48_9HYPH|nr:glutathione S-transferase family protein [Aquabacter spiritensis]TCT02439.1 glutathione S-transferase [Aquabacter spiritensis]
MALTLLIGNKNYSSWSLRAWLALTASGIPFEARLVPFGSAEFAAAFEGLDAPRRVPLLLDDDVAVWDSLAIIEHAAERYPDRPVWPGDRVARGMARAVAAEMHSSFHRLRRHLPMNLWRPVETRAFDADIGAEIARIGEIWRAARGRFGAGGDFLFGRFCAADAMFAPVATRFATYGVPLDPVCADYVAAIHAQPDFVAWRKAALAEPWVEPHDEVDWPEVKRVPAA